MFCNLSSGYFVHAILCLHDGHTLEPCIKSLMQPKRPIPSSFIRHDLPIATYGDKFGIVIQPSNTTQVSCAYPSDAWTCCHRKPCKTLNIEYHLKIRERESKRSCARYNNSNLAGVWGQKNNLNTNCCFPFENALKVQKEYYNLNHSNACIRGTGMNQIQLKWHPKDIVGVYYRTDSQRTMSKAVHRIVKGMYCQL